MHAATAILLAAAVAAHPIVLRCDRAIPGRSRALFSTFGVVVISKEGILVLDPRSCAEKWRRRLSPDSRLARPAVLIGDRLVLGDGDSAVAYALENGRVLWRWKGGRVQSLSAAPHLIAHVRHGHVSKILRLDAATGDVLAQRFARDSESLSEVSGVVMDVQLPNESDGVGYVVVAYDADDLSEIWRFRQTGSARFVTYDGVPYFASFASIFPIDLKSGRRGPRLPATGPVESTWGGSTRELETTDDVDGRSRLRRNDVKSGKALWTADVPFEVLETLRDGQELYVAGGTGREADPHSVATIDWRDGTLKKLSGPTPLPLQWSRIADVIVATTWDDRFVCFRP